MRNYFLMHHLPPVNNLQHAHHPPGAIPYGPIMEGEAIKQLGGHQ